MDLKVKGLRFVMIAVTALVVVMIGYITMYLMTTHVEGTYSANEMILVKEDKEYYLQLDDRKLDIDAKLVEKMDYKEDKVYQIKYRYTPFNDQGGKVESIQIISEGKG